MKKNTWFVILINLILVLVFSACQAQPNINPEDEIDGNFITGEDVYIDQVEINIMESFPLQVNAVVKGNLPDGCTKITEHYVEKVDDHTFEILIITQRPGDMMCTEALVPFEEIIALDVNGLPAGTYTVNAYGKTAEFTFEMDNVIPE